MGLNNAFMSLGRVIGPLWGGFVFDYSINLPYLSGAVIMFAGLVIAQLKLQPDAPLLAEPEPGTVAAK
jgi:DHA1 family multidrug resistance protein-like MFS transporter